MLRSLLTAFSKLLLSATSTVLLASSVKPISRSFSRASLGSSLALLSAGAGASADLPSSLRTLPRALGCHLLGLALL